MKTQLLFTKDYVKAFEEIKKSGGHITQKFTDSVFSANLPHLLKKEALKFSSPVALSDEVDDTTSLVVKAWNGFIAKQEAADQSRKEEPRTWDAKGFQYPKNPNNDEQLRREFEIACNNLETTGTPTSEYMLGSIALGLVIVGGNTSALKITDQEAIKVVQEVMEGCQFLANSGGPTAGITFVYNIHILKINAVPKTSCNSFESCESVFRDPALKQLGYATGYKGCVDFVNDLRKNNKTNWSYMAFITKYNLFHFAYASGVRLCMSYSNDGWKTDKINQVFAHETCHIFGAADEYTNSNCNCNGSGMNKVANYNCELCTSDPIPKVICLMNKNDLSMCPWTMGQIGWPNPNPVVNTAPFGIVYDNVLHNLYRDINNQISEMSFDGTNWNYGNFSKKLSSPVPPLSNGDPYAMVFNNNGNKSRHFLYRDVSNEISDIWFYEPNSQWAYQNLHTLVSASNPPLAIGNPCSVQFNITLQNGTVIFMQHNVFLDENDLISDIWFSGKTNKWYYQNLNTLVSSYNSPFAKGNPFAIIYNGQHHNLYRDKNDAISDIWYDPVQTKWSYQNLNTLVSASNPPLAKGNPFSVIYADGQHNLYLDANGKISDIWYNGISWLYQNLHNLVASSNPATAKGNPFSVVCNTSHQHNLYLDINNKMSDIWYDGSNWWYQNLHDLASSYNPPLAIGDPFVVVYGNQRHHFYRDTNYQMSDIWYDGSIWHYQAWII